MPGRPRKPAQTKKNQGTFHKFRNPEQEPEFSALNEIPDPPKTLNKFAKDIWKNLIKELNASGVMTKADLELFSVGCAAIGRAKFYEAHLEKDLIKNASNEFGGRSPVIIQMNADFSLGLKIFSLFGLTPADRNRLGLSKKTVDDPATAEMKKLIGGL